MSAPTVQIYIEDGHAHIIDATGHGTIPVERLRDLAHLANRRDFGLAWLGGRAYHRDALNSAVTLLDHEDPCQFADQYVSCDLPAAMDADGNTLTDLHDRPVCETHAPDDDPGEMA